MAILPFLFRAGFLPLQLPLLDLVRYKSVFREHSTVSQSMCELDYHDVFVNSLHKRDFQINYGA